MALCSQPDESALKDLKIKIALGAVETSEVSRVLYGYPCCFCKQRVYEDGILISESGPCVSDAQYLGHKGCYDNLPKVVSDKPPEKESNLIE